MKIWIAWCRKYEKCGNPYLKGEVRFPERTNPPCPRCGGSLTNRHPKEVLPLTSH